MPANLPTSNGNFTTKNVIAVTALANVNRKPQTDMSDLLPILDDLVAFSQELRDNPKEIYSSDLKRLERLHQLITYHVIYGARQATDRELGQGRDRGLLVARRCSIEGCWGGPKLWNIRAGSLNGEEAVWRCLAHIPPDMTFPVSLFGDEWKATGRK